jgi:hypothetical protein
MGTAKNEQPPRQPRTEAPWQPPVSPPQIRPLSQPVPCFLLLGPVTPHRRHPWRRGARETVTTPSAAGRAEKRHRAACASPARRRY